MRAPVTVLAAFVVALVVPSVASAAGQWDESGHPSASGRVQMFRASVSPAVDDSWAIGYSWDVVGGALEFRTLAQHWNGFSWTTVPTPDVETAPAKDLIYDAAAAGPDDIWAAGISATAPGNPASKPLVLHWDGTSWSIVPLPASPPGASLSAIAADKDTVWAMGEKRNFQSGYWQPFVLRRQDGSWSEVPLLGESLKPGPTGCKLADDGTLWRVDPGGIAIGRNGVAYVSGTCTSSAGDRAMLAVHRGRRWRSAFDPTTLSTTSQLRDVVAEPGGRVRAVGGVGVEPLVLRGAGRTFVRELAPTVGRGTSLNSITPGPPYYAVGTSTGTDAWAHPAAYRLAGGTWRSQQVSINFGNPFGVSVDPAGQAWVTGVSVSDDFGLILRRNGP